MTPETTRAVDDVRPGTRVALVIGNADYHYGPKLANPLDDATDIAAALTRLGFAPVTLLRNAGLKEQGNALADFGALADEADMAVIYFAGHGMEVDGENFLLPVDAELDHVKRLKVECVRLSDVLSHVDGARKFRLVILDACRDNPFRGRMRGLEATRSLGRGLARVEPQGNTLVAYAARDGTQAKDGKPGDHSPYALGLLRHLETPNVDVRIVFGRVRDEVLRMTGMMQEPHIYGTMGGEEVYLKTAAVAPAAASVAEASALVRELQEERDWEKAQRENSGDAYEAFIDRWRGNGGKFVDDAARKIVELREASDYADATAARTVAAYQRFLERWPRGAKSAEARATLETMEASAAFAAIKDILKQSPLEASFDTVAMRDFLARFPDQPMTGSVRERLAYGEERHTAHLNERHSKAFYEQYLRNYPDGANRAEVERLLAGGGDDRLWIEIQKTPSVALIESYLKDWPDGRHAKEAGELLPVQKRREKTRAVGRGVGMAGVGAWFLGIAGLLLFGIGSILWSLGQSAMSYDGSVIDWARKSLAELIAPKPEPPALDPQWREKGIFKVPYKPDDSIMPPKTDRQSVGNIPSNLKSEKPGSATAADRLKPPSGSLFGTGFRTKDDLGGGLSPSPANSLELLRNLTHPNTKAASESESEFALRMAKKQLGLPAFEAPQPANAAKPGSKAAQ